MSGEEQNQKVKASKGGHRSRPRLLVWFTLVCVAVVAVFLTVNGSEAWMPTFFSKSAPEHLSHVVENRVLDVTLTEQGTVQSAENTEIKCRVRGFSTVTYVIEAGSEVAAGDVLVQLDTKRVEDAISKHTTESHTARATLEESIANLNQRLLAEDAYLEGEYKTRLQKLERQLKVARTNLETAEMHLANSRSMFNRGFVTLLEVESNEFTVTRAKLELEVIETDLRVLEKYTRNMRLETIRGGLAAAKSKKEADESGLAMDEGRRDRAIKELEHCVIKASKPGLVIYPSSAAWKDTPDVTVGAGVRRDQTLLLMPDLSKMQVKVGIHESMIARVHVGMDARVTLANNILDGKVSSVASVARPAGWWTGNVVKYDVIIDVPPMDDLKPGMTAEVDLLLASYNNVVSIPVASVVQTEEGCFCWVKRGEEFVKKPIIIGDGNDIFLVVERGLESGDEVALSPRAVLADQDAESTPNDDQSPTRDKSESEPGKSADNSGEVAVNE
jgi:HlyD family secretion protein